MSKNETPETENSEKTPGFHVHQDKTFCGVYETKEDAQAFIDGQLKPQNLEGKITEVVGE